MAADHRPRRRFGQNFLADRAVLGAIVAAIAPRPDDWMLEIGPGEGALTSRLLAHVGSLVAIEIDRDLAAALRTRFPQLRLVEGDALALDLDALERQVMSDRPPSGLASGVSARRWRVVGNLPYNISTPLLGRLVAQMERVRDMHFLLQREVVDRLVASPGTKAWGRLSVYAQYHCDMQRLLDVGPQAFRPPPKVDSTFVRLTPRISREPLLDPDALDAVLRAGFQQRRKTLRNALREFGLDWSETPISPTMRPDQVDVSGYVALANRVAQQRHTDRSR
jgi:16S rRNA (adenine1518-N6/adenine1519-N6)-dimethyltransferase